MRDWVDLAVDVAKLIREAQDRLQGQPELPAAERNRTGRRLIELSEQVQEVVVRYRSGDLVAEVSPEQVAEFRNLAQKSAATSLSLKNARDVNWIAGGFDDLVQNFLSAGPHGPGKGPRIL